MNRSAFIVAAADVENETAIVFQNPQNLLRKGDEPPDVIALVSIPVFLL